MTRVNSPKPVVPKVVLTRGFCRNKEEKAKLLAHGLSERHIFMAGHGGETLEATIANFRDQPGELVVASDLRLFGATKAAIMDVVKRLELIGVTIRDITHAADVTLTDKLRRALAAISNARFADNPRKARRVGAKGGTAKGMMAAANRTALLADEIVRRLCAHPKLTWRDRADILGPPFSISSLQRHYRS